jgi:pimeloyl-ACP methyl ester carboxylesterase
VPTQFVTANGIRYAYRRFGAETGTPLVFLQHFRGGMDHWDPAVTDVLAVNRPVILFDNQGVAGTNGETPNTVQAQADDAATFIRALDLAQADVLGFSIGGYVAQALTLGHRDRRGGCVCLHHGAPQGTTRQRREGDWQTSSAFRVTSPIWLTLTGSTRPSERAVRSISSGGVWPIRRGRGE